MNTYHVYVNKSGQWRRVSTIRATDHSRAFREAMTALPPEHYHLPIRLEQKDGDDEDYDPSQSGESEGV